MYRAVEGGRCVFWGFAIRKMCRAVIAQRGGVPFLLCLGDYLHRVRTARTPRAHRVKCRDKVIPWFLGYPMLA